jgi:hypothetical protein
LLPWRVWLLLAVAVVALNELVDRNFFDHREHVDGNVVLTVGVVGIAFLASYAVVRLRKQRTAAG